MTHEIETDFVLDELNNVIYYANRYGNGYLLGMKGSKAEIEKCHTMFHNFSGANPTLKWESDDLAYILIDSPKALENTVKSFIRATILKGSNWREKSENDEDFELTSEWDGRESELSELINTYWTDFFDSYVIHEVFTQGDNRKNIDGEFFEVSSPNKNKTYTK